MKKMNEISRCRPRLELMCLNRQALTVGFEPTYLSARLFSKQPAYDLLHTSAQFQIESWLGLALRNRRFDPI